MAQINLTLNQEEILQLLADNSGETFKKLLEDNLNAILITGAEELLKLKALLTSIEQFIEDEVKGL